MDYSIQRAKVYCKLSLHRDQSRIWSGYGGVEDFFEGLARRKIFHDTSISTLRLSSSLLRVCRAEFESFDGVRAVGRGRGARSRCFFAPPRFFDGRITGCRTLQHYNYSETKDHTIISTIDHKTLFREPFGADTQPFSLIRAVVRG